MKIVAIREKTFPIASPIRNAVIDFSKMTLSAVAVVTDVVRGGRPVVGYGFNSNGRYGQGALLRERFIPRVLEADPRTLLDETGENLDPRRIWECAMGNKSQRWRLIHAIQTGCLRRCWGILTARTKSAAYFALKTAASHGRKSCTRMRIPAAQTWRLIRRIPT